MLRRLRERFTYANVVSTLALFLVLGTGTAYATHLIVRSSDVVDGSLMSADLKNGQAVKGADVINDSVEGADISEGTLSQVPAAMVGGFGRSAASGLCNTESFSYVRCVQVQLDLPRPARVLLNGRITAREDADASADFATLAACRWGGVQESGDLFVDAEDWEDISLVGLTNVIQPGQGYTFAIECREAGNNGVHYTDAWITAVAISPS